jgi:hypothetical protein
VAVHAVAEFSEGAGGLRDGVFVEKAACESVVTETNSGAFVVEILDVMRGSGARDDEANGV